jgi:Zn-finger nucleic acid-binding protein
MTGTGFRARRPVPEGIALRLVACPSCHLQYDVTAGAGAAFRCSCGSDVAAAAPAADAGRDATVRRCGACGAGVEGGARACPYCRAGLVADATLLRLLCPECFARNAEDSRFCTHCGVEFLPQPVPAQTRALACPACAEPLAVQAIGGVPVRECTRCAGLWVPGGHFDAMVQQAMEKARAHPTRGLAGGAPRAAPPAAGGVRYRPCPECAQPMNRKNFGRRSGVILDLCKAHGTWLDAEELEQVARFVLSGALERVEREASEAAAAEARAEMARAESRPWNAPRPPELTFGFDRDNRSLGRFLRGLLGH